MFHVFLSMNDNQFHGYRRWLNSEFSESYESTGLFSLIAGRPQRYTMLVNRFRFQLYKINVIQIHCIPFSDISIHTYSQFFRLFQVYTISSKPFVGDRWILALQGEAGSSRPIFFHSPNSLLAKSSPDFSDLHEMGKSQFIHGNQNASIFLIMSCSYGGHGKLAMGNSW